MKSFIQDNQCCLNQGGIGMLQMFSTSLILNSPHQSCDDWWGEFTHCDNGSDGTQVCKNVFWSKSRIKAIRHLDLIENENIPCLSNYNHIVVFFDCHYNLWWKSCCLWVASYWGISFAKSAWGFISELCAISHKNCTEKRPKKLVKMSWMPNLMQPSEP